MRLRNRALARCVQFHVRRYCIPWTQAMARWSASWAACAGSACLVMSIVASAIAASVTSKELTQNNISNFASHSWQYRVVPVAVKFLSLDTNGGEVLIRDFDACRIPVLVQFGLDR